MILVTVPRFSLANLLLEYRYKFDLNLPVVEHCERLCESDQNYPDLPYLLLYSRDVQKCISVFKSFFFGF